MPDELSRIHDVFHVSVLKKYLADPSHVLQPPPLELREDLSLPVQPVAIINRQVRKLRNKEISLVKVLWRSNQVEETWEPDFCFTSARYIQIEGVALEDGKGLPVIESVTSRHVSSAARRLGTIKTDKEDVNAAPTPRPLKKRATKYSALCHREIWRRGRWVDGEKGGVKAATR